ncbi:MAG: HIT domain-containing protein [Rhizobiaceae bacterium]|nr:HIT domain-containing protein [Rhizobiaceae bacterium]
MTAYDEGNVFAKILRGEIPNHTVFEDAATLAFMDVMPQGPGHCLVIPKAPARTILDVSDDSLAAVTRTVKRVAAAAKHAFAADGLTIFQFNEPAGGQTVFHIHFHVIPRFDGVPLGGHSGTMADHAVLAEHAAKIRAQLA